MEDYSWNCKYWKLTDFNTSFLILKIKREGKKNVCVCVYIYIYI